MQTSDHNAPTNPAPAHTDAPHANPGSPNDTVTQRRALLAGLGGLAAGAMFASRASAGPLNPPAGPITSTGKTLTEVEPRIAINATNTPGDATYTFIISQPGSYYLTGNVIGNAGDFGIRIAASNVTLDLNGFNVQGGVNGQTGIIATDTHNNVTVRNGTVTGWGLHGLDLRTFGTGINCLVENITVSECLGDGIRVPVSSIVRSCIVQSNSGTGISGQVNNLVSECIARANGALGIGLQTNCMAERCIAHDNGATGIDVSDASSVVQCTARSCDGDGINAGAGCLVDQCVSDGNTLSGIVIGVQSVVRNCMVRSNAASGISTSNGCMVHDSLVVSNTPHGILASGDSSIMGNTCRANGPTVSGAGIRVIGGDARIENNHCTDNGIGIDVTSSGNFIARNRCGGNTTRNWEIAASNVCLVVNASLSAAISGNAGGSAPGSTDPNANFSF